MSTVERRRNVRSARKAEGIDTGDDMARDLERARLSHLYRISTLLTTFESVDAVLPSIFGAVCDAVDVRCAAIVDGSEGSERVTGWRGPDASEASLAEAERRALDIYEYLVESSTGSDRGSRIRNEGSFIALPLVVDGARIFGVFYLEPAETADEGDLAFVSAIANQLAVAIDRRSILKQRESMRAAAAVRLAAESSRRRAEVLAETSLILGEEGGYAQALSKIADLVARRLVDACVLVLSEEDGSVLSAVGTCPEFPEEQAGNFVGLVDRAMGRVGPPAPEVRFLGRAEPSAEGDGERSSAARELVEKGFSLGIRAPIADLSDVASVTLLFFDVDDSAIDEWHEFAIDIGLRIHHAVEAARLYRAAQEASRARDEFLSVASHELKTPLTSLQLSLQNLLRVESRGATLTPQLLEARLQLLARSTSRLSELVDKLLDASRISAGQLELERTVVDLAAMARDVCLRFAGEAERAGSILSVRAGGPVEGLWDPTRLDQVITNLLSNAIKYGARSPIDLSVEASPTVARLVVADRGIGISERHISKIFDRFERAVSLRQYGGLGLGLFISRQIVEAHGGRITVSSRPGEGATFTVELPMQRDAT